MIVHRAWTMDPPVFPNHLSVLLADGNPYMRRLVRDMLTRVGLRHVLEAADGAEALSVLSGARPHLVALAWDLPILTGEEFVRLIRTPSTSPFPTVPVLAMVTSPQKYIIDRAIAVGVNDIIVRPFSPTALWARINEIVKKPQPFVKVGGMLLPGPRTAGSH
jgi:two-component system, chemotaxis family, chemotaxis protein CheY